jgi:hypothetical protein
VSLRDERRATDPSHAERVSREQVPTDGIGNRKQGERVMARRLAGTVVITGTDDENWPDSDEHVHRVHNIQMVLDDGQPAQSIDVPDVRWGGECRVEIQLTARIVDVGQVQVAGNAKLFEGDSEDTTDLEDEKSVEVTVPRSGVPAHHGIQLRNVGAGGGDHARISLSFTNSMIED